MAWRGGAMFDKQTLRDLAETIVYVNFLLALLAIIALYDQRKVWEEETAEDDAWHNMIEGKLMALERKVAQMEALLAKAADDASPGPWDGHV